jgi:hypothetical protein
MPIGLIGGVKMPSRVGLAGLIGGDMAEPLADGRSTTTQALSNGCLPCVELTVPWGQGK